jgi:hypothetical protein
MKLARIFLSFLKYLVFLACFAAPAVVDCYFFAGGEKNEQRGEEKAKSPKFRINKVLYSSIMLLCPVVVSYSTCQSEKKSQIGCMCSKKKWRIKESHSQRAWRINSTQSLSLAELVIPSLSLTHTADSLFTYEENFRAADSDFCTRFRGKYKH